MELKYTGGFDQGESSSIQEGWMELKYTGGFDGELKYTGGFDRAQVYGRV